MSVHRGPWFRPKKVALDNRLFTSPNRQDIMHFRMHFGVKCCWNPLIRFRPRGNRDSRSGFAACSNCGTRPGPIGGNCSTRRPGARGPRPNPGRPGRPAAIWNNSPRRTNPHTTPMRCRACRTVRTDWALSRPREP